MRFAKPRTAVRGRWTTAVPETAKRSGAGGERCVVPKESGVRPRLTIPPIGRFDRPVGAECGGYGGSLGPVVREPVASEQRQRH